MQVFPIAEVQCRILKEKIERNVARDKESMQSLLDSGWNVIRVWECELRNKANREDTLNQIYNSITSPDGSGYSFEEADLPMAAEPEASYS